MQHSDEAPAAYNELEAMMCVGDEASRAAPAVKQTDQQHNSKVAQVLSQSEGQITFIATSNKDLAAHQHRGQAAPFRSALSSHHAYTRTFSKPSNNPSRGSRQPMESTPSTMVQTSQPPQGECFSTRTGLVGAAMSAYNTHHNLHLDPNHVWLTILSQFGAYINCKDRAEQLRDRIVDFEGKKELVVHSNGTLFTADFGVMAMSITDEIAANIKDPSLREWFLPGFSTSTVNDNVAAAASCMAALQAYFEYKLSLRCGIPQVTLAGSIADWELLLNKVQRLAEFDLGDKLMSRWLSMLGPICDNLVASAQGKPDLEFWDTICSREGGGSGPSYLSGWITVFSVFDDKGKWQAAQGLGSLWPMLDISNLAHNVTSVPVTIDDDGVEYKAQLLAGQFVYEYDLDTNTISPRNDWCIAVEGLPDGQQSVTMNSPTKLM